MSVHLVEFGKGVAVATFTIWKALESPCPGSTQVKQRPEGGGAATVARPSRPFAPNLPPIVCVELFCGILAASTAAQEGGLRLSAVYFSDISTDALLVARALCPSAESLGDVRVLPDDLIDAIFARHLGAYLGICGALFAKTSLD